MTLGHFHLMLNHVPILGVPLALMMLIYAHVYSADQIKKFALGFLIVVGVLSCGAYFTGEPAEKMVEELPGVSESFIHEHEEAAEFAFVLTEVAAIMSLVVLVLKNNAIVQKWVPKFLLAVLVLASVSLARTGYLGGLVRHTELRGSGELAPASATEELHEESTDKKSAE